MSDAGVIGIARLVMHTKEHLAALIATGPALMLNTLRWADEIRPWKDINVPAQGKKALKDGDLKMAKRLVDDMTGAWQPEKYEDKFTHAVHALVAKRAEAGRTEEIEPMEEAPAPSNVVDLTELLAKSLHKTRPAQASGATRSTAKRAARGAPRRKAA